ncbi:MAG: carbohydrate kinase [Bacteroidota bacterium]
MSKRKKSYDVLCAGELLVDLMSIDFADDFRKVEHFKRVQGGSPANVAMNMAKLGNRVSLVAGVGQDDMGNFLIESLEKVGVTTQYIARTSNPTSLILVTRSKTVSHFEAYRAADYKLTAQQFPEELLRATRLFHTTCFALSKVPAQKSIVAAATQAHRYGAQLSIDLNYAPKIWANRKKAQSLVAAYCAQEAIVKLSEVDWSRLYKRPLSDAESAGQYFIDLGAKIVCITLGSEGVWAMSSKETHFLPSRPIEVKDTTGAGDAFWAGFLTAWLDENSLLNCAKAGRSMAELKIQHFGALNRSVERSVLYNDQ